MSSTKEQLYDSLKSRGWIENKDGSWSRPRANPDLGTVAPDSAKQTPARPLDGGKPKLQSGSQSVGCRVALIACRRRLLDPDAVAFACKPLTDAIASTLGIDDADPRVAWEWNQIKTDGAEGVIVKIEIE